MEKLLNRDARDLALLIAFMDRRPTSIAARTSELSVPSDVIVFCQLAVSARRERRAGLVRSPKFKIRHPAFRLSDSAFRFCLTAGFLLHCLLLRLLPPLVRALWPKVGGAFASSKRLSSSRQSRCNY